MKNKSLTFKCDQYEMYIKTSNTTPTYCYLETGGLIGNDSWLCILYLVGVITIDAKREPIRSEEKKVLNPNGN